jgi:phospholipid/cholesterol/gamma-HCH transport system substrate-binding protein
MESRNTMAVKVGIFVVVGIILLLGLSLRVDKKLFKKPVGSEIKANFRDVKGLEAGAPVMLAGINVGTVSDLEFDPESGLVKVSLFIRDPYRMKKDSRASILLQSLLGQYFINIEFGNPSAPNLPYGGLLQTTEGLDINTALKMISDVGDEVKKLARGLNENQESLIGQISDVIEENRENLRKTTASFAELGPRIDGTLDEINGLISGVKNGQGTIGKLFTDASLYTRLANAADSFSSITLDIRSGDGTLSKLIYSDDLSNSVQDTFKRVANAADNMNALVTENRDKLDNFVKTLESISPKIEKSINSITEISEKINSGQGTLGKLVNDPSLYENTNSAINQIKATFEESEEQSVVKTVLSILVGPVM